MINEVKQLNDFVIEADSIQIADQTINNILPGKYLVLMHIVNEKDTYSKGNLYLMHENFADESIPLDEYMWKQDGGVYVEENNPTVIIQNTQHDLNLDCNKLKQQLGKEMAYCINNNIVINMYYSDQCCIFNTLTEGNQIVGIRIDDIGSWADIPPVQLEDLIVSSTTVKIDRSMIENVIPGKYQVWKKISREDDTLREGNLYIIHENFMNDNLLLEDYNWKKGGSFDSGGGPVLIMDATRQDKLNYAKFKEKFGDEMADTIDNTVGFSMLYNDFGYKFKVLKEGSQIIGFHIDDIGSWINTPNVQLDEACTKGDLQAVKELLTDPEPLKRATLGYRAFYFACTHAHKDIIVYLMSSPDLENRSKINNPDDNRFITPFIILCHAHPEIVKELIMELPEEPLNDIKEFLDNPENLAKNREVLLETLAARESQNSSNNTTNKMKIT